MSLQKVFGYVEFVIGVILILGVIIGYYFVFYSIPPKITLLSENIVSATASKNISLSFFDVYSIKAIGLDSLYVFGSFYLIIFLLIGILFILQGILNIREE